jgi:exosortase
VADFLKRPAVLLALQLAACWPVWHWYAARVVDGSDEAWGVVALLTALWFIWQERRRAPVVTLDWRLPGCSMLIYAASFHSLTPLPRAWLALGALALTISRGCLGRRLHVGIAGLLLLSLPLLASLQFYLGYPLRALVAMPAAALLRLGGLAVVSEGACLSWGDQLILIDAPCSGIRLLWAGVFLVCTLACSLRLNARRTLVALVLAVPIIVAGNVWRATALFYLEAGLARLPAWAHAGVGVAVFAVTAVALWLVVQWLKTTEESSDARSRTVFDWLCVSRRRAARAHTPGCA